FVATPSPGSVVSASAMSLSQLFTAEGRIDDGLDSSFGLIRLRAANVYVPITNGSIQRGIDVASAGDTINVQAGTFIESLSIDKSVIVSGQGDTTVLRSPASIPTRFTTSADNHPIVFVTAGAKPTIK